ncbi:MAG: endonuclease III [Spirochaetales bacterium]|jgi:endonuclease-3|nr:endonuclease III [Spirochaetales bacterium]
MKKMPPGESPPGSRNWESCFKAIDGAVEKTVLPSVSFIAGENSGVTFPKTEVLGKPQDSSAFRILVSTMISLRTKDEVTLPASLRLFARASGPEEMAGLTEDEIAKLIFPAGFYRTKAANILKASQILLARHGGQVPPRREDLLALPGVGPKTASLVLSLAFGIPAICVDTHVHRVSNRLGWINTKTPPDSEAALMEILPQEHWISLNERLIFFGQQICTPLSPHCSRCPLGPDCPRIGVGRSR